jgi:uncharacterized protein (TIGR02246 family)
MAAVPNAVLRPLFVAAVLVACSGEASRDAAGASRGAADAIAADERAIRAADSALTAAVVAKDADRTAALYAEDAVLLPVAEPLIEGRAAIREEWAKVNGIPGLANRARLVRVEASGGSLAYTRGTYETTMLGPDGKPTVERGKWVTVWRRQADGSWRVAADIYNTDSPPPLHQESTHR